MHCELIRSPPGPPIVHNGSCCSILISNILKNLVNDQMAEIRWSWLYISKFKIKRGLLINSHVSPTVHYLLRLVHSAQNPELLLGLLNPLASGFENKSCWPGWWNLWPTALFFVIPQALSVMSCAPSRVCIVADKEVLALQNLPSGFLQNFGLKNSVPGSLQHVFSAESAFETLLLDSAKSKEISSRAISKPFTRVSRELIPLWELPMNFWIAAKQWVS